MSAVKTEEVQEVPWGKPETFRGFVIQVWETSAPEMSGKKVLGWRAVWTKDGEPAGSVYTETANGSTESVVEEAKKAIEKDSQR